MAHYETVIITRQDISTSQVEILIDQMAKILTDAGGNITRREYWGLRTLAYRIRKNRKGHYTLLNYTVDTAVKNEMERLMSLNTDVLRFLSLVTLEAITEPSVIMKERAYAEARPDHRPMGTDRGRSDQTVIVTPRQTPVVKVVNSADKGEQA